MHRPDPAREEFYFIVHSDEQSSGGLHDPRSPADLEALPPILDSPPILDAPPIAVDTTGPAPPVLSASPRPPQRRRVGLIIATVATGLLQILLSIAASRHGSEAGGISHRIGFIIGGLAVWPLILIGLFSIMPRFRTMRARLVILLSVWGVFSLGHLSTLGKPRPQAAEARERVTMHGPSAEPPEPVEHLDGDDVDLRDFDFSPGSAERFIEIFKGVQTERYHRIVKAYRQVVAERPHDAKLALERLEFIDHFAFDEENAIDGVEDDRAHALEYLKAHFPTEPGTVLYLLGWEYGEELESKAGGYERLTAGWSPQDRAAFLLLRANAAEATGAPAALGYARESFDLHPTPEAGILLAEKAMAAGRTEESITVLMHPVLEDAGHWIKKRKLDLLFETKQHDAAFKLYEELKQTAPGWVKQAEVAVKLADAGRIEAAREALAGLAINDWNRQSVLRSRFEFELKHGDAAASLSAYRELRAVGIAADPFLRDRFELFLRHKGAAWAIEDLAGAGMLIALLVSAGLLPLVLLVPVHYWSLLRLQKGKTTVWTGAHWGLRHAWLACASMMLAEALALWTWQPAELRSWLSDRETVAPTADHNLIGPQLLLWTFVGVTLFVLLWRVRGWRLLGPGKWKSGKAVGVGLAMMGALKAGLYLVMVIAPGLAANGFGTFAPQTTQLFSVMMKEGGPLLMLGAVAVFVPLIEELMFRGVLLQALGRHIPFGWANGVQSLAFALVHEDHRLLPFFFAFGLVCGQLARRSGGLMAPLVLHGGNNLLAGGMFVLLQSHAA